MQRINCRLFSKILLFTMMMLINIANADKLADLGLTPDGKPLIKQFEKRKERAGICLYADTGPHFVVREELELVKTQDLLTRATTIAELVIKGPTEEEKQIGFKQLFPPETKLYRIELNNQNTLRLLIDFPDEFISDASQVACKFDLIIDSLIKSLQVLPITGFEVLARKPGSNEYLPLDTF
ncbi:MAG: GerMN domain-containing protein, partial [Candidatus Sumerlaeia bacterium]|nr:GerMN domain-containing protein [Candidatus Sumerlaeia bacterium]